MPTLSQNPERRVDPKRLSESDLAAWISAVERGEAAEVARWIDLGFPLEARRLTHNQPTGLLLAAARGQPECVALLLAVGANAQARDIHGQGLAYWAVVGRSDRCLELAIEAGCDIEARGSLGDSAGAQAAMDNPVALRRLLAAGLDARAVDLGGQTLLMLAARFRQTECARLLIEAGADPLAVSNRSMTAVAEAAMSKSHEILALLAEAGGDLEGALEMIGSIPLHTENPLTPKREREIRDAHELALRAQLALREARALNRAAGPSRPARKPASLSL